jgi:RNA recognition motif-containing protein
VLFRKEQLEAVFSQFGVISTVYLPLDLRKQVPAPKGIAFVRYLVLQDALDAVQAMHNTRLGSGRRIQVSICSQKTYYSQNETPEWEVAHG